MKRLFSIISLLLSLNTFLIAQNQQDGFVDFIQSTYSAKNFISGSVSNSDIEKIINCGIKAPSARNSQMWKFTVVRDAELQKMILRDYVEGNVCIIISGSAEQARGINVAFDCALATQNMYLAAQSMGLGAHIYTGPISRVKDSRDKFRIPAGYEPVSVLRIGKIEERADAVTAASGRKSYSELVN